MHTFDRIIKNCSGKSEFNWIKAKPVEWRFCGDNGYEMRIGKYSKTWKSYIFPCTLLRTCQICGKTSTPKKVREGLVFWGEHRKRYGLEFFDSINMLCWSCRNRLRPLEKIIIETDKLRIEVNKLRKNVNESTKNNARTP
jgi:hypothetical protein